MQVIIQEIKAEDELVQGSVLIGRAVIKTDNAEYDALVLRTPHGDMAVYLDKVRGIFRSIPCS